MMLPCMIRLESSSFFWYPQKMPYQFRFPPADAGISTALWRRNLLVDEIDAKKLSHRITSIYGILNTDIGKIEPYLHQIHPQHGFIPSDRVASFAGRIDGVASSFHLYHGIISLIWSRTSSRLVIITALYIPYPLRWSDPSSVPYFLFLITYIITHRCELWLSFCRTIKSAVP